MKAKKQKVTFYKKINGVNLYEDKKVGKVFVDQDTLRVSRLKRIYNFKNYRTQEKRFRRIFGILAEEVIKRKPKGRMLDIGSGFGLFAEILSKKGKYQIDIIEPLVIPYYLKKIKHKHFKTSIEKFRSSKKFDIILMMDIIEHFKDPKPILGKVKKLLKKDGILVIQTPNYKSLMARISKNWAWWMVEDHKILYSPKSIKKLLINAGFKIIYFRTYEDIYAFKKNLDGNFIDIKNMYLRRILKGIYFSIFFPFYLLTRSILWKKGYGGLIYLIAK